MFPRNITIDWPREQLQARHCYVNKNAWELSEIKEGIKQGHTSHILSRIQLILIKELKHWDGQTYRSI